MYSLARQRDSVPTPERFHSRHRGPGPGCGAERGAGGGQRSGGGAGGKRSGLRGGGGSVPAGPHLQRLRRAVLQPRPPRRGRAAPQPGRGGGEGPARPVPEPRR